MTETAYIIFLEYLYTEVIRDLELHLKKKISLRNFQFLGRKHFLRQYSDLSLRCISELNIPRRITGKSLQDRKHQGNVKQAMMDIPVFFLLRVQELW